MQTLRNITLAISLLACEHAKSDGSDGLPPSSSSSSSTTGGEMITSTDTGDFICVGRSEVMSCTQPMGTFASWTVSAAPLMGGSIEEICTVTNVVDDGQTEALSLDCPAFDREIQLQSLNPHTPSLLNVGAEITLQYTSVSSPGPAWGYFALRENGTGTLLVAGVQAPIEEVALEPVLVTLRSSMCGYIYESCRVEQRGAVEVTLGESTVTVFDGNFADLKEFRILLDTATRDECYSINPDCNPSHPLWGVQTLIIRQ